MLNNKETKDKFSSDNEKLNNINSLNSKESGEVILADAKKGLFIKANDAVISVLEIQAEKAKKMGIFDFLRGNSLL